MYFCPSPLYSEIAGLFDDRLVVDIVLLEFLKAFNVVSRVA